MNTTTKERDYFFDNLKFFLIVLVVVGHSIEPFLTDSVRMKAFYSLIYTFHMPLFIFVAGYFAKNLINMETMLKRFRRTISLYLLFQLLYAWFHFCVFGSLHSRTIVLVPYWIMWFLLSLSYWYLLTPFFHKVKPTLAISFSVVLAIAVGYCNYIGYFLSLSRTFVFLPFFLVGFYFDKNFYKTIRISPIMRVTGLFLLATGYLFFYYNPTFNYHWFFGSFSYAKLGHSEWYAGIYRLGVYFAEILLSVAFLSIIPQGRTIFSSYGSRTLYAYLSHTFILQLLLYWGVNYSPSILQESLVIVSAVAFCFLSTSKLTETMLKDIVKLVSNIYWKVIPARRVSSKN